jgi:hypothetical protein
LTVKQIIVRSEIEEIVKRIMNSSELTVSDCFFTFSKEDYDEMTRKAEKIRAGLINAENNNIKFTPEEIFAKLNTLNPQSSKNEIKTTIEQTLMDLGDKMIQQHQDTITNDGRFRDREYGAEVKFKWGERLLEELTYVLISGLFSPKVYLLFIMNYKTMKMDSSFVLEEFIGAHKEMLRKIVMSIRDELINFFFAEVMKVIEGIAVQLGLKMKLEQLNYYIKLLKSCIDCFRSLADNGQILDWDMAKIGYADIYEQPTIEDIDNNC